MRRLFIILIGVLLSVGAVCAAAAYWMFAGDGLRHALESQATSWLGQPVRIGAARAQFLPRIAIQLEDIRVGEPVRLALADVELAADVRPLLEGRIENADVRVSDSRIDMPLPFTMPRSDKATEAEAENAPVRIVSVRSITLRDVRLRSRDREIVVSADSSLEENTLALRRFSAEAEGTELNVEGVITLSPRIDARLEATANRLDVDALIALADAFTPESDGSRGAQGQDLRMVAAIRAEQGTASTVPFRQFSTELALEGNSIALNQLRFDVFGGRYEGSLKARLGPPLAATIQSRFTDLDVAQLATFGGVPDSITGRLSASGTFAGSGQDVAQLLRDVRGNGTATIVDGTIQRLHLIRTVVLFFGRPAPDGEKGSNRFERLEVRSLLADRVLRAQTLSLHSADADMAGAGTLSLDTDALEGRVDLLLSEDLSAQAGHDLYRYAREGKRVVLPASIGGTASAPQLRIDAAAAAKRGLRNEVERRAKGLFERLGGFTNKDASEAKESP